MSNPARIVYAFCPHGSCLFDPANPDNCPCRARGSGVGCEGMRKDERRWRPILMRWQAGPKPLGAEPGPSLARKALNFTAAIVTHVAAGMPIADAETQAARLAACRRGVGLEARDVKDGHCRYFRPADDSCRHRTCGCHMPSKVAWKEQRCPMGWWPEP